MDLAPPSLTPPVTATALLMPWSSLPVELILEIASFLPRRSDVGSLRLLSKRSNAILQSVLWKDTTLILRLSDISPLLRFLIIIDEDSELCSSLPPFVTALWITQEHRPAPNGLLRNGGGEEELARIAADLSQLLEYLPNVQILHAPSIRHLYSTVQSPCPSGLTNISSLYLKGTMMVRPADLWWCMVRMPSLLELEAWVQIDAGSLLPKSSLASSSEDDEHILRPRASFLRLLKLQFWIQAFFPNSQNVLFQLLSTPTQLEFLSLYDISFYRHIPIAPLLASLSPGTKASLRHFELRQHVDYRVDTKNQFESTASFREFKNLETLILPCSPQPTQSQFEVPQEQHPFPLSLRQFRLLSPATFTWSALYALMTQHPQLKRIIGDVALTREMFSDLFDRCFPHATVTFMTAPSSSDIVTTVINRDHQ